MAKTGLPKLYEPAVAGNLGGPVRFTARLSSSVDWTVSVRDQNGVEVASGTGTGANVDWTWDASTAALDQRYTWTISAPDLRAATGALGTPLPPPSLRQVKVSPALVSPNGDGKNDQAKLTYKLNTQAIVTATVLDAANAPIATLFKQLRPAGSRSFTWKQIDVPDGRYRLLARREERDRQAGGGGRFRSRSTGRWLALCRAFPRSRRTATACRTRSTSGSACTRSRT